MSSLNCPNGNCECPHCPDQHSFKGTMVELFFKRMEKNVPFNHTFFPRETEYIFKALKEKQLNDSKIIG